MEDMFRGNSDLEVLPYYEQRLEAEWTALNALRELADIARKGTVQPTYSQGLAHWSQVKQLGGLSNPPDGMSEW